MLKVMVMAISFLLFFLLSPTLSQMDLGKEKRFLYLCLSLSLLNKSKTCFNGVEGTPRDHKRARTAAHPV